MKPLPGLNFCAWEQELGNDIDSEFILHGIRNGFDIIDTDIVISPVSCENHPSAKKDSEFFEKASQQLKTEIELGNYVICDQPPKIISPIAVIPKPNGDIRLIHDCSRPAGSAVNDYCTSDWKQKFSTVDDAASKMTNNCYFAKVDLKSAYRSVPISKRSQKVTGLKWQFNNQTVYLKDTKLPFGAKLSPGIFHRLTQAVKRIMAGKGYHLLVVYLDDFFIIADSKQECMEALNCLLQLLRKLGFSINWNKVIDPTTKLTFLGIELDSQAMTLRLPEDKLQCFRSELLSFLQRKRASKRQLQSLAGKLSWAAGVVKGGRVFLRRIFNKISTLKHTSHKTMISTDMRDDIIWWFNFMEKFNGRSTVLDSLPLECVYTDACDGAAGGVFGQDWFYFNWSQDFPQADNFHINEKEVLAVAVAAHRWAPLWTSKRIILHSDNSVTVACINKGTSHNHLIMHCLRKLFWLSATFNFHITARHIPGISNIAADAASRVHTPGYLEILLPYTAYTPLVRHMSLKSFSFLLNRFPSWVPRQ